ncbi:mechanosensitive ion channel family protein [Carnimonas bestiolae]|uniref:mechanosensitive ion channel family protein n=1 Tax=Carnimonas bestiolae TaxID=3402172 RepID=UPI003EDB7E58
MAFDVIAIWQESPLARLASYAVVAMVVSLILSLAARLVFNRVAKGKPRLNSLKEHVAAPMRWLVPLFCFAVMVNSAPLLDGLSWMVPLQRLLVCAMIGAATWLLVGIISGIEAMYTIGFDKVGDRSQRSRRMLTQIRVLSRTAMVIVTLFGLAGMLMLFPAVRQFGASMMASAGLAGLAVGFAARPVLSNVIAGLQIAMTQPISIDDLLEINGEPGYVEQITTTYIVVRSWDDRRQVIPLTYFIENPISNWSRTDTNLIGAIFLWFDYRLPLDELREEFSRVLERAPDYNGRERALQVCDMNEHAMQLRILVSADGLDNWWNTCCFVREAMISWVATHYPEYLPTSRTRVQGDSHMPQLLNKASLPAG